MPEGLSCGRDPTLEQEEEAAETISDELTTVPIPYLPAALGKEEIGRGKEWWEGILKFGLISHCLTGLYLE